MYKDSRKIQIPPMVCWQTFEGADKLDIGVLVKQYTKPENGQILLIVWASENTKFHLNKTMFLGEMEFNGFQV